MDLDKKIATRESYGKTLVELGKENEKVFNDDGCCDGSLYIKRLRGI